MITASQTNYRGFQDTPIRGSKIRRNCLVGQFDVNMPLLYGEGLKAFARLQEAIFLDDDDESPLAWKVPQDEDDERPWSPRSILTKSPADFVHSKDIISTYQEPTSLSSFSRLGLSITTLMYPHHMFTRNPHFYGMAYDAFLNRGNRMYGTVVIRIISISEPTHLVGGSVSFYRLGIPHPSESDRDDGMLNGRDWCSVHVRKNTSVK
ncbi:hypothetical protein BJ170DRAFT_598624 [Xylariales sp. AK1849]|nr:hypothetical protein BJ170DRAFT_598624 [Xylariales sp. AK1849]